jgi:bifunctional non-homologous end joining protein LigD
MSAAVEVAIQGRRLRLSNLEKVLYPGCGFTKGEVIDYYTRIAPALLPHLHRRPLTLKRYPNGVDAPYFYEKNCPSHRPDWVAVAPVWSRSNEKTIDYCLVDDLPTLVWVANLASLELHTSLSAAGDPFTPQSVVFDLDPGPPATIVECCRVALLLRDTLAHLGLALVAKTSGAKGMQLYIPLNTPATYDATKTFALAVAQLLERQHPGLVVSKMTKALRTGKVFIDWSQNDDHKTTISVYSLRAMPRPTVSAPVTWDEVEAGAAGHALSLEAPDVLDRLERDGDLFARLVSSRQELPAL